MNKNFTVKTSPKWLLWSILTVAIFLVGAIVIAISGLHSVQETRIGTTLTVSVPMAETFYEDEQENIEAACEKAFADAGLKVIDSYSAEIGTMKVNEELSALQTLGINPEAYLVIPKLCAMVLAMPLLTVCGDAAGIIGGMGVGISVCGIPAEAYWSRTADVLDLASLMSGLLKSAVFAILITMSGCYYGFATSGDAQGVGRAATQAVVASIFLAVVSDAVMTLLFSFVGW